MGMLTPPSQESFLKRLIASVTDPIVNSILRSGWLLRASVLLLVAAGWTGWNYRDWIIKNEGFAAKLPSAIERKTLLPLTGSEGDQLEKQIHTLANYLDGELQSAADEDPDHGANVWTISQIVVATCGRIPIEPTLIFRVVEAKKNGACSCWTEFKDRTYPQTASANWVAIAFSRLGIKLLPPDLDFILKGQHPGGWWAPFPALHDSRNASTYATSWGLLALHAQLAAGLIDVAERERAKAAIERGKAWLLKAGSDGARWTDYPNSSDELVVQSIGLSGLAVHALHELGAQTDQIDRDWLRNLPASVPNGGVSDASNYPITMERGGTDKDGVRHFRLPWTIIATVDAYPRGSALDRARALEFLDDMINSLPELTKPIMTGMPYASAELEIALRYLKGDKQNGADVI
jgi:hypothetical protein